MSGDNNIKTIFVGRNVTFSEIDSITPALPVGHYALNYNPDRGQYYLTTRKPFKLPAKIYSDPQQYVDRFLSTYRSRGQGMGVLLSGDKGTGKTLLAKMLANQCNMPVIRVTHGFTGQALTEFIEMLQVPCMFLVDEFEKLYDAGSSRRTEPGSPSEYFLTLLDGTTTNRHLWVLTSNSHDVGEYFTGRPGRIRYHKQFHGLEHDMIEEIVNDTLRHKDLIQPTIRTVLAINNLSLDSLMSILEEVNIHKESPDKFMSYFNVTSDSSAMFSAVLYRSVWTFPIDVWMTIPTELKSRANYYLILLANSKNNSDDENNSLFLHQINDKNNPLHKIHRTYGDKVTNVVLAYTSSYCSPFGDMDTDGSVNIHVNYMRLSPEFSVFADIGDSISESIHVAWDSDEIESMTQVKGRITVKKRGDTDTLVCTPVKRKTRSYTIGTVGNW